MNKHLAIAVDTSGRVGSVAAGSENTLLCEVSFTDQLKHAAELFPSIIELTNKTGRNISDISEIYVTAGPGSFTGLRIGITLAKMMALASNVKIAAVSSLDCLARNAFDYIKEHNRDEIKTVAAVIDAKRGHFFLGFYQKQGDNWVKSLPESMKTAQEINDLLKKDTITLFTGEALKYYKDKFAAANVEFMPETQWSIKASNVYKAGRQKAAAGQYDDPQLLLPQYLRLSDAEENLLKKAK